MLQVNTIQFGAGIAAIDCVGDLFRRSNTDDYQNVVTLSANGDGLTDFLLQDRNVPHSGNQF